MNDAPKGQFAMDFVRHDALLELARGDVFRPGFAAWLADNRHVWHRFEAEAHKVRARGRKHYSARTIVEVLRHESALADSGEPWKLNDHNTPDLARLYLLAHPDASGFFETRLLSKSDRGDTLP
jgi:hypothetical protein